MCLLCSKFSKVLLFLLLHSEQEPKYLQWLTRPYKIWLPLPPVLHSSYSHSQPFASVTLASWQFWINQIILSQGICTYRFPLERHIIVASLHSGLSSNISLQEEPLQKVLSIIVNSSCFYLALFYFIVPVIYLTYLCICASVLCNGNSMRAETLLYFAVFL